MKRQYVKYFVCEILEGRCPEGDGACLLKVVSLKENILPEYKPSCGKKAGRWKEIGRSEYYNRGGD